MRLRARLGFIIIHISVAFLFCSTKHWFLIMFINEKQQQADTHREVSNVTAVCAQHALS